MCCVFTILVLLGPRFGGAIWWLLNPNLWQRVFQNKMIWPVLGIIFLPWVTLMYVIFAQGPGGIDSIWEWLFIGLALIADIGSYTGGGYRHRNRIPGYSGD